MIIVSTPAIQLDYMRFVTDSTAECFMNEYQVLKKYNPEIPFRPTCPAISKTGSVYIDQKIWTSWAGIITRGLTIRRILWQ